MLNLPEVAFMNVKLHPLTMEQVITHICGALRAGHVVNAVSLNVAKLVALRRDPDLRADVASGSLVLADGMGIVWGARLSGLNIPERVAGVDLMNCMMEKCVEEGWQPYFLGARPAVLERAVAAARKRYPGLKIAGWQHGYYDCAEVQGVVSAIRESGATCLFVGMPTPKKEQFLARHAADLGVPFRMGVGGALDILAGVTSRAPTVWQTAGFEWLYRLIQEPRRMWWRYLETNTRYLGLLAVFLVAQCWRGLWRPRFPAMLKALPRQRQYRSAGENMPALEAASDTESGTVRCRTILAADLPAVEALLREGFPSRQGSWFTKALETLSKHTPPPEYPQFGYALDCAGQVVGALLVITSTPDPRGHSQIRRNASCWYVRPAFRVYAPLLIGHGVRRSQATDVNISPALHTWRILEAQGFKRFCDGLFVGFPLLSLPRGGASALDWQRAKAAGWPIPAAQEAILREHESFGCFSLVCRDSEGMTVSVFRERRFRSIPMAAAQVIFCEQIADLRRFGSVIGYQLLRRGYSCIVLNANCKVRGIPGYCFPGRSPMYYRGVDKPESGDLLYTEAALFGF